jgi:hypothetical protein
MKQNVKREANGRFAKGRSGNPSGRPPISRKQRELATINAWCALQVYEKTLSEGKLVDDVKIRHVGFGVREAAQMLVQQKHRRLEFERLRQNVIDRHAEDRKGKPPS